jgi:hypothetical protein
MDLLEFGGGDRHPSFGLDIVGLSSMLMLIVRVIKIGVENVTRSYWI